MRKIEISDAEAQRSIVGIERQLAKAFAALGKVSLPKKGEILSRSVTVTSRASASIHIVVSYEHSGGFYPKPTGLYSVLVQEVRGSNSRVKLRARSWSSLPPKLTAGQVMEIVACVKKHLEARDQVELEFDAKEAEQKRAEQGEAKRHARLKAIGKAYGIRNADHGTMISTGFTVRCQGDSFTVSLDHLSEAELRGFLDYWTKRKAKG